MPTKDAVIQFAKERPVDYVTCIDTVAGVGYSLRLSVDSGLCEFKEVWKEEPQALPYSTSQEVCALYRAYSNTDIVSKYSMEQVLGMYRTVTENDPAYIGTIEDLVLRLRCFIEFFTTN